MFRSNTVFVVGAGASSEVGFPTGDGLKYIIKEKLNLFGTGRGSYSSPGGDPAITAILRNEAGMDKDALKLYYSAAQELSDAMDLAPSIDNYLHAHNSNPRKVLCGKLAIAQSILEAESGPFKTGISPSTINTKFRGPTSKDGIKEHWFIPFFKLLSMDVIKEKIHSIFDNISFISFNYDRCIEHFFYNALQNYYNISDIETEEIMEKLVVLHPYGQVGHLPWQKAGGKTPFGGNSNNMGLLEVANQIQTFTEAGEGRIITDVRERVREAHTLVFLGFGYHELNMKLLCPSFNQGLTTRVFGTARGMSKSNLAVISDDLQKRFLNPTYHHRGAEINNEVTCNQLFYEYWNSLLSSD